MYHKVAGNKQVLKANELCSVDRSYRYKKTVDKKDFTTQQIKTKDCHLLHAIAGRLLSASHSGSLSEYSH